MQYFFSFNQKPMPMSVKNTENLESVRRFKSHILFLIALLLQLLVSEANAGVIIMQGTNKATINEETNTVSVEFIVTNKGDEAAEDIKLEFPSINRMYFLGERLAPSSSVSHKAVFEFEQLDISDNGSYILPARVQYKDLNLYQFSAAYPVLILRYPVPSRQFRVSLLTGAVFPETILPGMPIEVVDTTSVKAVLTNTSQGEVSLESFQPFSASEVIFSKDVEMPIVLASGESLELAFDIKVHNSIPGSKYGSMLILSGSSKGVHFSEYHSFVTHVVESSFTTRNALIWTVSIFLALALLYSLIFKRRAKGA